MADVKTDSISSTEFGKLFFEFKPRFIALAYRYVRDRETAEDLVSDSFMTFWEMHENLPADTNVPAYILTSVKNRCLNFLRHKLIEEEYNSQMKEELGFKLYALETFNYSYQSEEELQEVIQRALDTLPERCREVFIKSRIEGLKYKEISDELGISVNTVENQMVTALKKLRVALKDYLPLLLFLVN